MANKPNSNDPHGLEAEARTPFLGERQVRDGWVIPDIGPRGEALAVPRPSEQNDFSPHYRILAISTDTDGNDFSVPGVLVVVDPSGAVVFRAPFTSGGAGFGSLPGLGESALTDDPIVTEYPIDWGDIREDRLEPGFTLSNGQPGWSMTIENPSADTQEEVARNLAIGLGERDLFRIHPSGRSANVSLGCIEFGADPVGDILAMGFLDAMQDSIPPSMRPRAVEILNVNNLISRPSGVAYAPELGLETSVARTELISAMLGTGDGAPNAHPLAIMARAQDIAMAQVEFAEALDGSPALTPESVESGKITQR